MNREALFDKLEEDGDDNRDQGVICNASGVYAGLARFMDHILDTNTYTQKQVNGSQHKGSGQPRYSSNSPKPQWAISSTGYAAH